MKLTADEHRLLPSDEDVAFYREHGWYISEQILPEELVEQAIQGSERHFAGERDFPLRISTGYSDWKPGSGNGVRNCEYVALQNRQIRHVVEHPLIGAIASRLSGSRTIRLFYDQLIYKPPDPSDATSVVGWHTDRAYWMTCTSDSMLTAWIPFHDCPEDMAPLVVVDGSHRWPVSSTIRAFKEKNLGELEEKLKLDNIQFRKVPIILKKGQVSFHHCLTIHGSDVNRAASPRQSLAVHMQDAANRYRLFKNEQGIPWRLVIDRMCRTIDDETPDYTDPDVCPVLWSDENV